MQSEIINNANSKNEKSKLIESMLDEVGMTKQELIDLLTNVVELEAEQSLELDNGKLFVKGVEIISGSKQGSKKDIVEVLSRAQIMDVVSRVGLASVLIKAKKLGLTIDAEVAALVGLDNKTKFDFQNFAESVKNLSKDQLDAARKIIEEQIKRSREASKEEGGLGGVLGAFKGMMNKAADKLKNTLHVLDYKEDVNKLRHSAREVEVANRKLLSFENEIKSRFGEISKIKYRKGEVLASVEGLSSMVNLKEYIKSKGELTEMLVKLIDDAGSTATAMQKNIAEIHKAISTDVEGIGFDKEGKLMVEKILEGTKKKIHINDYLTDLDRMSLERMRAKNKGEDDLDLRRQLDLEELKLAHLENEVEVTAERINVDIKKETQHTKEDIVKIDIIADKAKIIEAQQLMREGMKDMKEAMQNKDLVENMRKEMMKNRELDK